MECPPLGPGGEDITWPDQVAPRGRKASSTRKIKPQTSNRNLTKGKGNSERAHKPASNGVFPHVASPLERRVVSHPIWGMLPFPPICVSLSLQREK